MERDVSCAPRAPWGGAGVQLQGVGELSLQGGPGIRCHPQKYRSQGAPNHQERQPLPGVRPRAGRFPGRLP